MTDPPISLEEARVLWACARRDAVIPTWDEYPDPEGQLRGVRDPEPVLATLFVTPEVLGLPYTIEQLEDADV